LLKNRGDVLGSVGPQGARRFTVRVDDCICRETLLRKAPDQRGSGVEEIDFLP
jgi:hypothetical protein